MAKTVNEAFDVYLSRLVPTDAERSNASTHRTAIEAKLEAKFGLYRMFESGSWKHGTGVRGKSDVDYFISLKSAKPMYGSTALTVVRDAMLERFPNTYIHASRPAVVLEFGGGYERVELIPAYPNLTLASNDMRYQIPGVTSEWMESTPEAHLKYVNESNGLVAVKNGTKALARLAKAWKFHCNVPISSFYLEMRAAQYMRGQSSVIYPLDVSYFFNSLQRSQLASMNDPTGSTGRINACSSDANLRDALSKLDSAVTRATKALASDTAGKTTDAFEWWDLVFGGTFPAYY
jgi:hypothetical protein